MEPMKAIPPLILALALALSPPAGRERRGTCRAAPALSGTFPSAWTGGVNEQGFGLAVSTEWRVTDMVEALVLQVAAGVVAVGLPDAGSRAGAALVHRFPQPLSRASRR